MRKKWTYVAVACMLLGTAPVFTGCIDTDEPAGLEDLRGAKSELLRAKAAVEAAKVAEVQAQAALLQAQAKVEEANAVKVQAEAEKIKAEAAIAQAKADYINAKTEQEKAIAQGIIDENNRIQAEWEAEAAVRQAEAEAAIKQAQLATAEALAKYQTVIAALQDTKNKALEPYITKLEAATEAYYYALDELTRAQRVYNQQAATIEENEASKNLLTRDLQREVMLKQKGYDGVVAAIERANAELEEAKTLEPHALQVKYAEVLEEQNTIKKEIADLSVQAAEEAVKIYNEQVIPLLALGDEINELTQATQKIAAVTFDFGSTGDYYPAYVQRGPIELEEMEYTYADPANYEFRKYQLEEAVKEFKSWTRDASDNAWTTETIAELQGLVDINNEETKVLKAEWQEAVDAYRTGKYQTTDPSKISGYEDVTKGITSYNEDAAKVNEAYTALATLQAQQKADEKTLQKTKSDNAAAYKSACEQADAELAAALKTASTDYQTLQKTLTTNKNNAYTAWQNAEAEYQRIFNSSTDAAEIRAARNKADDLKEEYDLADKALTNLGDLDDYIQDLKDECTETKANAKTTQTTADANAQKAYDAKWNETTGTEYAKLAPAREAIKEARKLLNAEVEALVKVAQVYNGNAGTDPAPIWVGAIESAAEPLKDETLGYKQVRTLSAETLVVLDKDALAEVIKERADVLFGSGFASNAYGDWDGRLVELTDAEILKQIEEALDEIEAKEERNVTLADYLDECAKYGMAGERLALQEQIRIAKSWLNNSEAINGKIAEAEAALKALTDAYDALEASIEAKNEEHELALETLIADLEDTYAPVEAKRLELVPLDGLLMAIAHAIADYAGTGEAVWDQESIDNYIANIEAEIQNLELDKFDAETLLLRAQDNLNKWNNDAIKALEIYANNVADAETIVERRKAEVDKIQAALDAVIASLTNDPTASTEETPSTQE